MNPIKRLLSVFFFILCVLLAYGTAFAATYYISTTGNNNNDGLSPGAAWDLSALESTTKYAAGDTIIVLNGTYTFPEGKSMEQAMVWLYKTGTISAPITIQAETVGGVILDGDFRGKYGFNLEGNSMCYITITGFEIKNMRWGGICTNNQNYPSHHVTLYRNHIHHIGMRLEYNEPNWDGIVGIGTNRGTHHWVADSNIIHDIGRTNPSGPGETDDNWLHDHGWYMSGNTHTAINNIFYNITHGWGIITGNVASESPIKGGTDCHIINNTFIGPDNPCRDGLLAITSARQVTGLLFSNNIFEGPTRAAIWWYDAYSDNGPTAIVRNNITTAGALHGLTASVASLANITNTNNILNTSAGFVDAPNRDYNIISDSPCKNNAYTADLPDHDYASVHSRPLPVGSNGDIGAYEIDETSGGGGTPSGNELASLTAIGSVKATYAFSNIDGWSSLRTTTRTRKSQQFTGDGTGVSQIQVKLKRVGSPTGSAYVKIYNTSAGVPTGSTIATSGALDVTTVTNDTNGAVYTFTFATPFDDQDTVLYAWSIEFSGDADNYISVGGNAAGGGANYPGDDFDYESSWVISYFDLCFVMGANLQYSNTYSQSLTTEPGVVTENGVSLTPQTSIAAVNNNAGSWYWASNVIYVSVKAGGSISDTFLWLLPEGQVAAFPFTEGSGNTITDSINSLVGTINNGAWRTWKNKKAVFFNGTNTNISVPANSAPISGLRKFSLSAWIYPSNITYFPRMFSLESATSSGIHFSIGANGYVSALVSSDTDPKVFLSEGSVSSSSHLNHWSYMVLTYDDTDDRKLHIYVNGIEITYIRQDTLTGNLVTSSDALFIGNRYSGDRPFKGMITGVKIYNYALSSGDIATNYASEWPLEDRIQKKTMMRH